MSDVEFTDEQSTAYTNLRQNIEADGTMSGTPKVVAVIMKIGLAKNVKQANIVLIAISICIAILAAVIFYLVV